MNPHDVIDLTEDVDMIHDDLIDLTPDEEEEPLLSEFSFFLINTTQHSQLVSLTDITIVGSPLIASPREQAIFDLTEDADRIDDDLIDLTLDGEEEPLLSKFSSS